MNGEKCYYLEDSMATWNNPQSKFLTRKEANESGIRTAQSKLVYIFRVGRNLVVTKNEYLALVKKYPTIKLVKSPEIELGSKYANKTDILDTYSRAKLIKIADTYKVFQSYAMTREELILKIRECKDQKMTPLSPEKVELVKHAAKRRISYEKYREIMIRKNKENSKLYDYPYTPEDDPEMTPPVKIKVKKSTGNRYRKVRKINDVKKK